MASPSESSMPEIGTQRHDEDNINKLAIQNYAASGAVVLRATQTT